MKPIVSWFTPEKWLIDTNEISENIYIAIRVNAVDQFLSRVSYQIYLNNLYTLIVYQIYLNNFMIKIYKRYPHEWLKFWNPASWNAKASDEFKKEVIPSGHALSKSIGVPTETLDLSRQR